MDSSSRNAISPSMRIMAMTQQQHLSDSDQDDDNDDNDQEAPHQPRQEHVHDPSDRHDINLFSTSITSDSDGGHSNISASLALSSRTSVASTSSSFTSYPSTRQSASTYWVQNPPIRYHRFDPHELPPLDEVEAAVPVPSAATRRNEATGTANNNNESERNQESSNEDDSSTRLGLEVFISSPKWISHLCLVLVIFLGQMTFVPRTDVSLYCSSMWGAMLFGSAEIMYLQMGDGRQRPHTLLRFYPLFVVATFLLPWIMYIFYPMTCYMTCFI